MANIKGNSMKDIEAYMGKQILSWLTKEQMNLPKYLEEFMHSEYYDQYETSDYYERQYRIIEAIMVSNIVKKGNTYTLSIYLDPNKVSYDPAVWYNRGSASWNYMKGDKAEDVFNLIANGIHGDEQFGKTDGRFWDAFIESVNHGGIYDIFEDFKKHLKGTGLMVI